MEGAQALSLVMDAVLFPPLGVERGLAKALSPGWTKGAFQTSWMPLRGEAWHRMLQLEFGSCSQHLSDPGPTELGKEEEWDLGQR